MTEAYATLRLFCSFCIHAFGVIYLDRPGADGRGLGRDGDCSPCRPAGDAMITTIWTGASRRGR